jgi:hypothetical protein
MSLKTPDEMAAWLVHIDEIIHVARTGTGNQTALFEDGFPGESAFRPRQSGPPAHFGPVV